MKKLNTLNRFHRFKIRKHVKKISNPVPVTNEWKLMLSKNLTFISFDTSCEILEWKSYKLQFSFVIRGHHVYKKVGHHMLGKS